MTDETTASAGTVTARQAATADTLSKVIDVWHREHFAGSSTTELWNASFAAKEDLKKRLAAL